MANKKTTKKSRKIVYSEPTSYISKGMLEVIKRQEKEAKAKKKK